MSFKLGDFSEGKFLTEIDEDEDEELEDEVIKKKLTKIHNKRHTLRGNYIPSIIKRYPILHVSRAQVSLQSKISCRIFPFPLRSLLTWCHLSEHAGNSRKIAKNNNLIIFNNGGR
jgi:hypothetical protein